MIVTTLSVMAIMTFMRLDALIVPSVGRSTVCYQVQLQSVEIRRHELKKSGEDGGDGGNVKARSAYVTIRSGFLKMISIILRHLYGLIQIFPCFIIDCDRLIS